jgi:hypothetical protein
MHSITRRIPSVPPRMRTLALGAVVAFAAAAGAASPASAVGPTGDYAQFDHCPRTNTAVDACLYSETTGGSFALGNATVPVNKKIILQGGIDQNEDTGAFTFVPAVGADTLSKTKLNVPGGLTGLMSPTGWNGILSALFWAAVGTVNDVTATAEQAGTIGYDFGAFAFGGGPALTLPVRIHLENPFLGSNCYIGTTSAPVLLKLRTDTTSPPAPNSPITGSVGTVNFLNDGDLITDTGNKLVDNSFAVPAVNGCGGPLFGLLVNTALDLKEGFPSAAGKNTAILTGSLKQASRTAVVASVH